LLSDHVRFWFGPGIPGRSVWCSIILVAGVHVSHADEVRQPARLGEDIQHHGRKQRDGQGEERTRASKQPHPED
jgi:hypothetical protein